MDPTPTDKHIPPESKTYYFATAEATFLPEFNLWVTIHHLNGRNFASLIIARDGEPSEHPSFSAGDSTQYCDCEIRLVRSYDREGTAELCISRIPPNPAKHIEARLRRLRALFDDKLIAKDEFERKKTEILSAL